MIKKIDVDKYVSVNPDLTIITFDKIFELVVIHVINIIYNIYNDLSLIEELNKDVKKIIIFSLLDQIYNRMIRENDINSILYINTSFTTKYSEIWTYIDKNKLEYFIIKKCKEISSKAPLAIYVENGSVDLLSDSGETKEVINKLNSALIKFKSNITSLSKLKEYSKDNGLIQFMDKYYSEDNIKKNAFYNKYLKGAIE